MVRVIFILSLYFLFSCSGKIEVVEVPKEVDLIQFEDSVFHFEQVSRYFDKIQSLRIEEDDFAEFAKNRKLYSGLEYIRLEEGHYRFLPKTLFDLPNLKRIGAWGTLLQPAYVDSMKDAYPTIEINYHPYTKMVHVYGDQNLNEIKEHSGNDGMHVMLDCDWDMKEQFDSLAKYPGIVTLDYTMCESMTIPKNIDQFKELYKLHIGDCDLSLKQVPKTVGNLKSLRDIYGNGNYFPELPKGFYELDSLNSVTFWRCAIRKISPRIGNWKRLELLFLDYNQIKSLPQEIGKMEKLQLISIIENPIRSFPSEIKKCKSLKWIYIDEENWDPANLDSLRKWFPNSNLNEYKKK